MSMRTGLVPNELAPGMPAILNGRQVLPPSDKLFILLVSRAFNMADAPMLLALPPWHTDKYSSLSLVTQECRHFLTAQNYYYNNTNLIWNTLLQRLFGCSTFVLRNILCSVGTNDITAYPIFTFVGNFKNTNLCAAWEWIINLIFHDINKIIIYLNTS